MRVFIMSKTEDLTPGELIALIDQKIAEAQKIALEAQAAEAKLKHARELLITSFQDIKNITQKGK